MLKLKKVTAGRNKDNEQIEVKPKMRQVPESLEKDLKATTIKMLLQASILLKQVKKVDLSKEIEAIIKN